MADERAANAVDRKVGIRVRARRLEIGMTQERLAEILGITFQQVQKYEKGSNRIAASRLHDISQALDLPLEDFFEGLGKPRRKTANTEQRQSLRTVLSSPEGREMLSLFAALSSKKARLRAVELVRALAEPGR